MKLSKLCTAVPLWRQSAMAILWHHHVDNRWLFWAPFQYPIRRLIVRSRGVEAARLVVCVVSLWNLTGTSAAVLPICLSNFRAIGQFQIQISRLRDFVRSYSKTSFRILKQDPARWGIVGSVVLGKKYNFSITDTWIPQAPPAKTRVLKDGDCYETTSIAQ